LFDSFSILVFEPADSVFEIFTAQMSRERHCLAGRSRFTEEEHSWTTIIQTAVLKILLPPYQKIIL